MGFGDFLYNNFNSERRREREETRREAMEIRQEAKEILQDAKDLYSDYKELRTDTRQYANELDSLIKSHNNYKSDILRELGGEVAATIENFKRFNIDSRIINAPKISEGYAPNIPSVNLMSAFANMPGGSFNPINLIFSSLSDPYEDRRKADKQRDDAREYYWKVEDAYNKLRDTMERLRSTKRFIDDEREMLGQLMSKVRKIMLQLKSVMNRTDHTQNEAKYMNAVCHIAEKIKISLEQQITDNYGGIQSSYKNCTQQLKKIAEAIPNQPIITDSSSWLDTLIRI